MLLHYTRCWHIKLTCGINLYITSHEEDLYIDNQLYKALPSLQFSAIESTSDLRPDNYEISALLADDFITQKMVMLGEVEGAEVTSFMVNYLKSHPDGEDLSKDSTKDKILKTFGYVGKIRILKNIVSLEVKSVSQLLTRNIGEVYTPYCRAEFCDTRCKLNSHDYTFKAKVIEYQDHKNITISLQKHNEVMLNKAQKYRDNFLEGATLRYVSKEGYTSSSIILSHTKLKIQRSQDDAEQGELTIALHREPFIKPAVGDIVEITEGCDKNFKTCYSRFDNAINFRGEPFINDVKLFPEQLRSNR